MDAAWGYSWGCCFFNGDMHAPQVHKLFVQKVSSFSWAAAISVATTRPAALMGEQRFNGEQTWTPLLYAPDIYIYIYPLVNVYITMERSTIFNV